MKQSKKKLTLNQLTMSWFSRCFLPELCQPKGVVSHLKSGTPIDAKRPALTLMRWELTAGLAHRCGRIISSPMIALTRGRDSDFSGIGGDCQVTGKLTKLSLVAYCWRSGWEHFSSNNRRTVTDRPGTKIQLFSFASVTMAIGSIIVFCSSNQPAMFFKYTLTTKPGRQTPVLVYTTDTGWYYSY